MANKINKAAWCYTPSIAIGIRVKVLYLAAIVQWHLSSYSRS